MKISYMVESIGSFQVKTTKGVGKLGAKFAWKLKCQKFNQINGKV